MKHKNWAALAVALSLIGAITLPAAAAAQPPAALNFFADSDLSEACRQQGELPSRQQGWTRNRFEQCHRNDDDINLYTATGAKKGELKSVFEMLTFANYADRRIDVILSLEGVEFDSALFRNDWGFITVSVDGCTGLSNVTCVGETYRTDDVDAWAARPLLNPIIITSPPNSGATPYYTVNMTISVKVTVEYRDGRTVPWQGVMAISNLRFDSAGQPIGSAPQHGSVILDHIPTQELDGRPGSDHRQEAVHVDDALRNPARTFPSFIGKAPPGAVGGSPLRRLMGPRSDVNRAESHKVCIDVWGANYSAGGLQCDEYPYASTYEGAATATAGISCGDGRDPDGKNWRIWHGSARPIDGTENQRGGTLLSAFYRLNRMLDCDEFYVQVIR
ncbi:hypothetical protein [Micromonospora sp. LOL_023]|uniref:NucA/NucB deoxyribonuclease domain-containing protein n=1 Tax=Micromonospora sp. LOL_023 TaxID=3345418 RepID=UPI003A878C60